jgi:hypothetical protein
LRCALSSVKVRLHLQVKPSVRCSRISRSMTSLARSNDCSGVIVDSYNADRHRPNAVSILLQCLVRGLGRAFINDSSWTLKVGNVRFNSGPLRIVLSGGGLPFFAACISSSVVVAKATNAWAFFLLAEFPGTANSHVPSSGCPPGTIENLRSR